MTNVSHPVLPPRPRLGSGAFALLTLGFLVFVVYGSLVPLQYEPLSWDETFARWHQVVAQPLGINSRSDFVTNVLLFIPLSFLLLGTLAVDRSRSVSVLAAVPVVLFCCALSASIEFTQLWFPPRVSSINDVLAETVGGVLGALFWITAGQQLTDYVRSIWNAQGPDHLAVKVLPFYLLVLVVIQVLPLDLTISPAELYHKWKEGRIILVPFTADYGGFSRGLVKNAWNVAFFLPLGLILSFWPGQTFRRGTAVLAAGVLIAAGIEFLQLFVWSRSFDVTDIVTGGLAVWLGWWFLQGWQARQALSPAQGSSSGSALLRPCLFLAWFLAMVVVNWLPGDVIGAAEAALPPRTAFESARRQHAWVVSSDGRFIGTPDGEQTLAIRTVGPFIVFTDWEVVRRRWQHVPLVPLVDLWEGSPFHALEEVLQKAFQFLPLGMLLAGPATATGRRGLWRALLAGLLLSSLLEAGQLFVPDRTCSTSDVLIETSGAVFGFLLWRRVLVLLREGRPDRRLSSKAEGPVRTPVGLGVFVTDD
jgi:glycopeptide antibiotics resistance protein